MPLSSMNSGKYLLGKFNIARNDALEDSSRYSAEQLTYLEITEPTGKFYSENFMVDTMPIVEETPISANPRKRIDVRTEGNIVTGD